MAKKRRQLTIAAVKRMIGNSSPTGVDEAAVVELIQANLPAPAIVLGPEDPVPANTPANTLIGRTT